MSPQARSPDEGAPFVGCAGWSLRAEVSGQFEAGSSHLARYASRLNAVEINSSFYRPHRQSTYARWAASVPAGFRFSVKVPKQITHESRLVGADEALNRFLSEVAGLGDKLAVLLVQLPPSLPCDWPVARGFFGAIRDRVATPVACEARHASWFSTDVDDALAAAGIIRVVADPPVVDRPEVASALSTAYFRLHGSPRMYYSAYTPVQIEAMAERLRVLSASRVSAWCIFDNTAAGAAIENALEMRSLLNRKQKPSDFPIGAGTRSQLWSGGK
jgi:uncharacterized protein YecE (DUF72 family)